MRSSGCSAKNSLSGSEGSADFRLSVHYSSTILALSRHYLEAEVGIALHHCSVPILTTPMQINPINYARSTVKSGFQRPLRKSRTILPIAFQNFLTILPVSFYWSFYWRLFLFR